MLALIDPYCLLLAGFLQGCKRNNSVKSLEEVNLALFLVERLLLQCFFKCLLFELLSICCLILEAVLKIGGIEQHRNLGNKE